MARSRSFFMAGEPTARGPGGERSPPSGLVSAPPKVEVEVSGRLVGPTAFKAAETGDPRLAGSIPVHLRSSTWRPVAPSRPVSSDHRARPPPGAPPRLSVDAAPTQRRQSAIRGRRWPPARRDSAGVVTSTELLVVPGKVVAIDFHEARSNALTLPGSGCP